MRSTRLTKRGSPKPSTASTSKPPLQRQAVSPAWAAEPIQKMTAKKMTAS
jgi:hypothetical protein